MSRLERAKIAAGFPADAIVSQRQLKWLEEAKKRFNPPLSKSEERAQRRKRKKMAQNN